MDPYVISLLSIALITAILDVIAGWVTRLIAPEWFERWTWQQ